MSEKEIEYAKGKTPMMFEYQAPATLNQGTPVQNDWYDILPTTTNVRVYSVAVNVEDVNEDLEVQIIVDGETIASAAWTATHSTNYFCYIFVSAVARLDTIANSTDSSIYSHKAFVCEGHSIQIQVRKTTATGTGNLTGIVAYGVLKGA